MKTNTLQHVLLLHHNCKTLQWPCRLVLSHLSRVKPCFPVSNGSPFTLDRHKCSYVCSVKARQSSRGRNLFSDLVETCDTGLPRPGCLVCGNLTLVASFDSPPFRVLFLPCIPFQNSQMPGEGDPWCDTSRKMSAMNRHC